MAYRTRYLACRRETAVKGLGGGGGGGGKKETKVHHLPEHCHNTSTWSIHSSSSSSSNTVLFHVLSQQTSDPKEKQRNIQKSNNTTVIIIIIIIIQCFCINYFIFKKSRANIFHDLLAALRIEVIVFRSRPFAFLPNHVALYAFWNGPPCP